MSKTEKAVVAWLVAGVVVAGLATISFEPAEHNGVTSGNALADWTSMMDKSVRNHPDMGKGSQ